MVNCRRTFGKICAVSQLVLMILGTTYLHDAGAQVLLAECGELVNAYGPYDYANASDREERLKIVESYHFTSKVENLVEGQTGALVNDLDYTLRAFPNHTRALWAMVRYQMSSGKRWSPGDRYFPLECYFDRALRFRPNDAAVWMVYGMYFAREGNYQASIEKYERALTLQPDSAEINYNFGLALFETKQYARSRKLAEKAYELGYPLLGLMNMLRRAGYWGAAGESTDPSVR